MKDLLKLLDLSREEIVRILDVADQMKYDQKHRLPHPVSYTHLTLPTIA